MGKHSVFFYLLKFHCVALLLHTSCAFPNGGNEIPYFPQEPESRGPTENLPFEGETDLRSQARALLFRGPSAWEAEIASLAAALNEAKISFHVLDADEINSLSDSQWKSYQLTLVPGGYAPALSASLSQRTKERMRAAVQTQGMSYIGFCAGAWLAISPPFPSSRERDFGIGFIDGPVLQESELSAQGAPYLITPASLWNNTQRSLLWYGGPNTPEAPQGVLARYPNGKPAITQLRAGRGILFLSGLHPAITPTVLYALGILQPEAYAPDLTQTLIQAGIQQRMIPIQD